ncbi:MAG: hypothetical protein M9944_12735 [Rhizobiaceae bacterium]|nr:hypothetical protein [Rhizobiaceae bacterium]
MAATKRFVQVTHLVEVTMDDEKFDADFMAEFTASFYPYDTLEEHAEHLGQMYARGIVGDRPNEFIEGYGPASEMGIAFRSVYCETDLES